MPKFINHSVKSGVHTVRVDALSSDEAVHYVDFDYGNCSYQPSIISVEELNSNIYEVKFRVYKL